MDYFPNAIMEVRFGTMAMFSCNEGYGIDNGQDNVIHCDGDGTSLEGTWDNNVPTCEGIIII